MIITDEMIEAAVRRLDALPQEIMDAKRRSMVAEHKAKVCFAMAFSLTDGSLRHKEMEARQNKKYQEFKLAEATQAGILAGLYAEKDACQARLSIWQTENANNRRPL